MSTFVPVKSEEELLSAVRAGLLWYNGDVDIPRAMCQWFNETDEVLARILYRSACVAASAKEVDPRQAIPEDFAVLVEDE